jgi:aspartate racemase
MMKAAVIGIAGVTVPGALDCLSKMHQLVRQLCGGHHHHPRFVLDQPDFGVVHAAQLQERWDIVEDSIVGSLQRLAAAGAQVAVIPANTVHCCIDGIRRRAPLPLISMLDVVAARASSAACAGLGCWARAGPCSPILPCAIGGGGGGRVHSR